MIKLLRYKLGLISAMLIIAICLEVLGVIAIVMLTKVVSAFFLLGLLLLMPMGFCTFWCVGLNEEVARELQRLRES